jgi:DNA polymerase-3 subunit gamma/tau
VQRKLLDGEMMNHIALYRKYRPKSFDEVIGQDHITKTLQNQIMSDKIGHAYLFTGSRGTGKTSVAKIFARSVNCLSPVHGSACGECENCLRLEKENDINIIEIDAASNNKVDDIREIRDKVKFMPVGAKYKVYIIDEVHMLSDSAFNALLKTLEEPPSYVIFILATTEVHKLPQTILSRCVRFDFRLVSTENLMRQLAKIFDKEGIKYDEESLKIIASAGEGSVRDTLSIADSIASYCQKDITKDKTLAVLGTTDHDLIISFFDEIKEKDVGGVLSSIDQIEKDGKNLAVFAKDLSKHARNLLVCKSCSNANEILNLPDDVLKMYQSQAEKFEEKELIRYMQVFSSAESELRYTLSVRLLLETTCLTAMLGFDVKKN